VSTNGFIECRNLFKSFGEKAVLQGVNLTVQRGETMVILGGSGSGKTVLLKHMNGLIGPQTGQVFLDGLGISPTRSTSTRRCRRRRSEIEYARPSL